MNEHKKKQLREIAFKGYERATWTKRTYPTLLNEEIDKNKREAKINGKNKKQIRRRMQMRT